MTITNWNIKGITSALFIQSAWLASAIVLILEHARLPLWSIPILVLLRTFLYTGLFITVHDAMHGSIAPDYPRLNRFFGQFGALMFAMFSLDGLSEQHHAHHHYPGQPGLDPDFHPESRSGYLSWLFRFGRNYVTVLQIVLLALVFNLLEHGLGADPVALILYWVLPSLLSTLQLFTFGTYLPHRGNPENAHHARSSGQPVWLSFITCFHFGGFHFEHHESPSTPWWKLPSSRSQPGLK